MTPWKTVDRALEKRALFLGVTVKEMVSFVSDERSYNDGVFIYLNSGFKFDSMECGTAHEYSAKDMKESVITANKG